MRKEHGFLRVFSGTARYLTDADDVRDDVEGIITSQCAYGQCNRRDLSGVRAWRDTLT